MTLDNYTQIYDAGETSEVIVDLIVGVGAGLVAFATLIALVLLFNWFRKNAPRF